MDMRLHSTLALAGLVALAGVAAFCQPAPKPDPDRILKLFTGEFVELTPGKGKFPASFTMGTRGTAAESPPVTVRFKKAFAIARYEVTQELYQVVMGNNPSKWPGRRNSVEMVSWDDASTFCRKVTTMLRARKLIAAGEEIRLPSEAEWEYACRAGTTTAFSFGNKADDLGAYAWYQANSKGEDPPVGRKKPNAWGLYDMHGYVWEWCADAWSATHKGATTDGSPRLAGGKERVIRGGSFADPPERCRCAARAGKATTYKDDKIGFRCIKAAARKEKEDRK
jgi:formylglycine-generating enzyme required for sulfatase activity